MSVTFDRLNIEDYILKVIDEYGFKVPTKIQISAINEVLNNKDIIATAKTGSGKTLVYAIRLIQNTQNGEGVQGIVLVPTRELAKQVGNELEKFSKYKKLNIMVCYGGGSLKLQKKEIANVDLIVGTPGRICDYVEQDLFQLGKVKTIVLDEVDSMMQKQFSNEIDFIFKTLPKKRQTLVFSATISKEIHDIVKKYMYYPKRVAVDMQIDTKKLKQVYYVIENKKKLSLLAHFLKTERAGLSIIFTNRQDNADFLGKNLKSTGLKFGVIHGDLNQGKRNRIINDFRCEKFDVLIATDFAARGLDISNVSHIYNYNIPKHSEKYIHRIGRTARAGAFGKVINLISEIDIKPFLNIMNEFNIVALNKELPNFDEVKIKKKLIKKKHRR